MASFAATGSACIMCCSLAQLSSPSHSEPRVTDINPAMTGDRSATTTLLQRPDREKGQRRRGRGNSVGKAGIGGAVSLRNRACLGFFVPLSFGHAEHTGQCQNRRRQATGRGNVFIKLCLTFLSPFPNCGLAFQVSIQSTKRNYVLLGHACYFDIDPKLDTR